MDKTVKNIIKDYLIKNNYDGLTNTDIYCGCGLDDFMPCSNEIDIIRECKPAYKKYCRDCPADKYCNIREELETDHCYSIIRKSKMNKMDKKINLIVGSDYILTTNKKGMIIRLNGTPIDEKGEFFKWNDIINSFGNFIVGSNYTTEFKKVAPAVWVIIKRCP